MTRLVQSVNAIVMGTLVMGTLVAGLMGCSGEPAGGPPQVAYGSDVCAECNMILNDVNMDSALVVEGPRGPEALLFDDIGDQLIFEKRNAGRVVVERWARDLNSGEWVDAAEATFMQSPNLRSPMGSGIAAFASRESAQAKADELGEGLLFTRQELWAIPDP